MGIVGTQAIALDVNFKAYLIGLCWCHICWRALSHLFTF